jgi:tRNA(Ile)-lysidine synthase
MSPAQAIDHFMLEIANRQIKRLVVAYSGGMDSQALLFALHKHLQAIEDSPLTLCALHINHGISTSASQWQQHCQQFCIYLGVAFTTIKVTVKQGANLEANARAARYCAFRQFLQADDCLVMAHHLNDQAETLLLRLLRGSGLQGLAAIPYYRRLAKGYLYRPWLRVSKTEITQFAQTMRMAWVEDDTNEDTGFDRNFVRHRVLPVLQQRWPSAIQNFSRSADLCRRSQSLMTDLGQLDFNQLAGDKGHWLDISGLLLLSTDRQKNVLSYWLNSQQVKPTYELLNSILSQVVTANQQANPLIKCANFEIRRYRQRLYLQPGLPAYSAQQTFVWPGFPHQPLKLTGNGGVKAEPAAGQGLALAAITRGVRVKICFRQGGERCRPHGRVGSHPLKKLLQEQGVPPWLRNRLPLLYLDDTLVAAAGLWICQGFQATADQPGLLLEWQFDWINPCQ